MNETLNTLNELDNIEIACAFRCDIENIDKQITITKSDFTLLNQNITSVYCNFDDFLLTLANLTFTPDIIILTECWLCENKPIPALTNYTSYFTTRYFNQNDGVIAYIKNNISTQVKEVYLDHASCLQIQTHNNNNTILAIYRSPSNNNADSFINSLNLHLDSLKTQKNIIITGDININTIPKETEQSYQYKNRLNYLEMLSTHHLMMGHNLPTRKNSCLDHFVLKINRCRMVARVAVLNTTITDHATILLCLAKQKFNNKSHKTKKIVDYDKALMSLIDKNLTSLLFCDDPELLTQMLIDKVKESLKDNTYDAHIPKRQRVIKPWITTGILRCIRNRNNMQKRLRANTSDEILKLTYRRYRNFCNKLIKKLKRDYERKLLYYSKRSSKSLWNSIKTITHTGKSKTDNTKLLNIKSCPHDSANHVNEFFANIGSNLADAITQTSNSQPNLSSCFKDQPQSSSFVLLDTDPEEVHTVLMGLKSESASGWDDIPAMFLKRASKAIVPIIVHLANLCFARGVFPSLLKQSIITPVHKSGDREDVNNYRPISVLTSISKIIEKLINNRLITYLNKFNILSDRQYGFRRGKSTQDAVIDLTSKIIEQLDNKGKCLTVFLDLKKAFDTVSVPILVKKLEKIGVRGAPLDLFRDYLSERKQRVRIGQTLSGNASVNFGVPQGSVLGPTLFLIYINELCNIRLDNTQAFSYADDTAIVFTGDSWDSLKLQAERGLAVIARWLELNLLTLNTSKTNYMCFTIYNNTQPDNEYDIKIHNCINVGNLNCNCPSITKVNSTKYLGVTIDQRLSWHSHVEVISTRIRKLIWIFKTLRHVADKDLLNNIYVSLAQSIIIYCITVWGSALKTKFIQVERAQRLLLKVMYFKKRSFSTRDLYLTADLLSVRQLYVLHTLLRKHVSLGYDSSLLNKRRKDIVAKIQTARTVFARNQYVSQSTHLYNHINKHLNIYPMLYHECKHTVTDWLKTLNYNETEKLLEYDK